MTGILNKNSAVIYSVQEDKIYDRELLNEIRYITYCEMEKSDYRQNDLLLYLYAKTEKDDLLWKLENSGKFKVDF